MARRIDAGLARKAVALLRAQELPAEAVLARAGVDTATLRRKGARSAAPPIPPRTAAVQLLQRHLLISPPAEDRLASSARRRPG